MKLGRIVKTILLWGGWFILTVLAFLNAAALNRVYDTVSLRYHTPVTQQQAESARRYAAKQAEALQNEEGVDSGLQMFWPTYWNQEKCKLKTELASAEGTAVVFTGDSSLVWPAQYITGSYPGETQEDGCAVSSGFAWQLWGSNDVVGNTFEKEGKKYTVGGVFEEKEAVVLINNGQQEYKPGWIGVELKGTPQGDIGAKAKDFAEASGLGKPDTLLMGPSVGSLARAMALIPPVLLFLAGIWKLFRTYGGAFGTKRQVLLFVLLLVFALALPTLLTYLPARIIPTRWSDFSFWKTLWDESMKQLEEFLLLHPYKKDLMAKRLILQQGVLLFAGVFILPFLYRRSFTAETLPVEVLPDKTDLPEEKTLYKA